jgi:hypothetical protein
MPEPERQQPIPPEGFTGILNAFDQAGYTIPELLLALLTDKHFKKSAYTLELLRRSGDILQALLSHAGIPKEAEKAASKALHPVCAR